MPDHFTTDDVERVARLAHLALTNEEKQLFAVQLGDILKYAEQIRQVDTSGIPPTSHAAGTAAPLRADERRPCLPRAEALAQAPDADREAGLFKVPRVLGS